eukprot:m51a1_g9514 hypothetical protein (368) ;mRNA; f:730140-731497
MAGSGVEELSKFLGSPLWLVPIQSFIDERCVLFDTEEENAHELSAIHDEYRTIVDELIQEFSETSGLSSTQLLDACQIGMMTNGAVFDHLMAADDFLSFKKMMSHRNAQLDLEAYSHAFLLLVVLLKYGVKSAEEVPSAPGEEKALVEQALELSRDDTSAAQRLLAEEQAALEHAIAMSLALEHDRSSKAPERTVLSQEELEALERSRKERRRLADAAAAASAREALERSKMGRERQELAQKALSQLQAKQGLELQTLSTETAAPAGVKADPAEAEQQEALERLRKMLADKRKAERDKALEKYKLEQNVTVGAPVSGSASESQLGLKLAAALRQDAASSGAPLPQVQQVEGLRLKVQAERALEISDS